MIKTSFKITTAITVLCCLNISAQTTDPTQPDPASPKEIPGMTLVWNDEFNIAGKPNSSDWKYESGFVRNEELQWYQSANATCKDGVLLIEGRKERVKNPGFVSGSTEWKKNREYASYTSASINTSGLKSWKFGHFEIRARINTSKGSWPAIWTLGNNGEWPQNGEIDILEFYLIGGVPSILANFAWGTTTRWVAKWDGANKPLSSFTSQDSKWAEKFHLWTMDWNKDTIRLSLDGILMNETLVSKTVNPDGSNPFLQPHYILLNLALGANGGDPAQSVFPIPYEVDYVRVYQKATDIKPAFTVNNRDQFIESRIINNKLSVTLPHFDNRLSPVISIYGLNGSVVRKQSAVPDYLNKSYSLDLKNIPAGSYVFMVSGVSSRQQMIFIR